MKNISVFFPVYQDEKTIYPLAQKMTAFLEREKISYEIIIINDGSTDQSGQFAEQLRQENQQIKVVHHPTNKGYGSALQSGFRAAANEFIFYTDGDGQYDVNELEKFLPYADTYDVINGYKLKRHDPLIRRIAGEFYRQSMRLLFQLPIRDVTCDFRLIRKSCMDSISLESQSGFICVELIAKLRKNGARFKEIGVHHYSRRSGKSQAFRFKNIVGMCKDALRVLWKLL